MKYEPKGRNDVSFFGMLMQPFLYDVLDDEPDWDLIDTVASVVATLDEEDQRVLHLVFYERRTFDEAAEALGIKAKSHAWRKTQKALESLKTALMKSPTFRRRYEQHME
jgi:DNA-directed RNA polymerase specialized sigma subunit